MKTMIGQLSDLNHDDLVVISEYNPAIEKIKTGETIVNIFHWLLDGWIKKVSQDDEQVLGNDGQ